MPSAAAKIDRDAACSAREQSERRGRSDRAHVRQDGCEPSPRGRRYYAVVSRGWQVSLRALERDAEAPPIRKAPGPAADGRR